MSEVPERYSPPMKIGEYPFAGSERVNSFWFMSCSSRLQIIHGCARIWMVTDIAFWIVVLVAVVQVKQ